MSDKAEAKGVITWEALAPSEFLGPGPVERAILAGRELRVHSMPAGKFPVPFLWQVWGGESGMELLECDLVATAEQARAAAEAFARKLDEQGEEDGMGWSVFKGDTPLEDGTADDQEEAEAAAEAGPLVWRPARYPSMGATCAEKAFIGPGELFELVAINMPACRGIPAYCHWQVWGGPFHGVLLASGEAETAEKAKPIAEAAARRLLVTAQLSVGQVAGQVA